VLAHEAAHHIAGHLDQQGQFAARAPCLRARRGRSPGPRPAAVQRAQLVGAQRAVQAAPRTGSSRPTGWGPGSRRGRASTGARRGVPAAACPTGPHGVHASLERRAHRPGAAGRGGLRRRAGSAGPPPGRREGPRAWTPQGGSPGWTSEPPSGPGRGCARWARPSWSG
jgi:hypothetical protein